MAESSLNDVAAPSHGAGTTLVFGSFTLDSARHEFRHGTDVVPLRPKTFALLEVFANRPGQVLSKQALIDAVWPSAVVTDDSLTQCIHDLRTALGAGGAELVRTVARRGYRFDASVRHLRGDSTAGADTPARQRWLVVFGGAVTIALGAALLGYAFLRGPDPTRPATSAFSLVVLPLRVDDPSQEWFADALTSDLTSHLGQLRLLVISRDTAMGYRGKQVDPREVAKDLAVRYVVQGSVRRQADRVQLDLAMVDGETGAVQWTDRQDFARTELGSVLGDTAKQVARSLNNQMWRSGAERVARLRPDQVNADDLAMQGWATYYRGYTPENLKEALRLFEESVARDPQSLRGWGGVAIMNGLGAAINWVPDKSAAIARAKQAAERLESIDQESSLTFTARSNLANLRGDYDSWLAINLALIDRYPSHPAAYATIALASMNLGRFDDCVEPVKRAIRIGPRDPMLGIWQWQIGTCHFMRGEYADAARHARLAQEANRRLPLPPLLLAAATARSGNVERARTILAEYRMANPAYRVEHIGLLMRSQEPHYLEGLQRLTSTLRELGMP